MKPFSLLLALTFSVVLRAADYVPRDVVWTSQSQNSSGSMPCGGHDIGMNVWVEDGDLLWYVSQSGWFDANNTLLKAGRWRLHVDGNPFGAADFRQTLRLDGGEVVVEGGGMQVTLWADVYAPVVYVDIRSAKPRNATLGYESWRHQDRPLTKTECQQSSWKWLVPKDCVTQADDIVSDTHRLTVTHQNPQQTVFDFTVAYEHLEAIKDSLYNPIGGRRMSVVTEVPDFTFSGTSEGRYASTDYRSWNYTCPMLRRTTLRLLLDNGDGTPSVLPKSARESARRSQQWWHQYWQRSWIQTDGSNADAAHIARNYDLFRYLLGCNAYSQWPTKFNGGLFTFDPEYVERPSADGVPTNPFTPDYRKWGGGTMTAQNQRLVYWPMLKSGDIDMMVAQFDTYLRMLPNAMARTRHYWGHGGASFTEQTENFGLPNPAEYGKHPEGSDYGTERNAWLEYEWDTVLEFCMMILEAQGYQSGTAAKTPSNTPTFNIDRYRLLVSQCLQFFDEHYQYLAKQMGSKALTDSGQLIIYPGSACETYKMAYNPSSTIAALRTVAAAFEGTPLPLERIPEIPLHIIGGDTCIAPAMAWSRVQNEETPQLYPVFPWRVYGLGRPSLDIARNTYLRDPHAVAMRSSKGWKQDNIWAACLGLTDEARRLCVEKFADGPYRFPVFWEPGFDWAPDLNRGGSAMIGVQEMLLQETPEGAHLLFPAWPRDWNATFRLHDSSGHIVEGTIRDGVITERVY
ncbi:MAG: hypothetical protein J5637_00295 [Prevotella sp.]|nr:hypothetical protein [Prevotella sp.]